MQNLLEPYELFKLIQNDSDNLIIVDLSAKENFDKTHVAGAIWLDYKFTQNLNPPHGYLPSIEQLQQLFGSLGHQTDKTYIVYDDEGGGWAGRFIWLLDCIGHHKYFYLNGGHCALLAESLPVTNKASAITPTKPQITINQTPIADLAYVQSKIGDPNTIIWDARSPAEYRGEKVLTKRGGHIPGAVNLEWTDCMDKSNSLRIKNDLPQLLENIGITQDKEIITYCQAHHRSGFTYLVAKVLGFPKIKAYAGAFSEWGNSDITKIVTST